MLLKQAALKKARHKQFFRHMDDGTEKKEDEQEKKSEDFFNEESTNAEILKAVSEEERAERKRKLEEQLFGQKETKMSKSKKKRLDKYIEHQLKREEKKELFKKLEGTRFDTTLLKPSRLLGTGSQTKKEQYLEALELEKQGRGNDETKDILYEERVVKDWQDNSDFEQEKEDYLPHQSSGTEEPEFEEHKSTFIDSRPVAGGFGFGFQNIQKVEKKLKESKKSYSWRLRVALEDRKKAKVEDEDDFESSDEEIEGELEDEEEEEEEEGEEEEEEENDSEEEAEGDSDEGVNASDSEEIEEEDEDESDNEEDDEESDSDGEESESEELSKLEKLKPHHNKRGQSFKEWAENQVRELEGRLESIPTPMPNIDYKPIDRPEDKEDFEDNYIPINTDSDRKVHFVEVERPEEIQRQRMQLPVFAEEHRIMELIHHNDCVIICGETGSGKTTQVPQFLFEAGYGDPTNDDNPGIIGVTQPRRVAAVSMAERVSNELGNHGSKVGYQIRFDTTTKSDTALKFMTDGVLLREMMNDFLLRKYSAIIIDEAHERNINTDILIGMLSRVMKLRAQYHAKDPKTYKKLKVIIMSATLRVSDFSENKVLFDVAPPILKVDARQYPVSVHFNRRTAFNYIDELFRKTCKIHQKLPPGAILVFMTGQNEINTLVKRLRNEFPFPTKKRQFEEDEENLQVKINPRNADTEVEDIDFSVKVDEDQEVEDDYDSEEDAEGEEEGFEETLEDHQTDRDPLYVLPLYSLLPTKEQMKVFKAPPPGSRLCIIATNVAETSLTIPGVRYVVDCGRSKERKFNEETGVQSFEIDWVSKASANQRAGRAGRTGPGHCYRLYSSAIYENDFLQFSKPEILRMPVESVILSMKSMGIDNIVNFPFPTPPDRLNLSKSEKILKYLGALDRLGLITELGRTMSLFPLSPRFAKMLIVGNQNGCLDYLVAIVSGLSVGDPFISELELGIGQPVNIPKAKSSKNSDDDSSDEEEEQEVESFQDKELKRQLRQKFNQSRALFGRLDKYSDALKLLSVICSFDHVPEDKRSAFIRDNFLRGKLLEEIVKLRKQILYIVKSNTSKENIAVGEGGDLKLGIPSKTQIASLKQMITAGFIDQVAIRGDLASADVSISNKTSIIRVPYMTLFPSKTSDEQNIDSYVYIHPSSIIANAAELPPPYLVYSSLNLSSNSKAGSLSKLRMRPLCDITGKPLANIAKKSSLITYSKPLGHPYAPRNLSPIKRECYVIPRFGASIGSGGVGWDLPVVKVVQIKVNGSWVNE